MDAQLHSSWSRVRRIHEWVSACQSPFKTWAVEVAERSYRIPALALSSCNKSSNSSNNKQCKVSATVCPSISLYFAIMQASYAAASTVCQLPTNWMRRTAAALHTLTARALLKIVRQARIARECTCTVAWTLNVVLEHAFTFLTLRSAPQQVSEAFGCCFVNDIDSQADCAASE